MPDISKLVTALEVTKKWNEKLQQRKPFLGEAFFPTKVQTSRMMNSIKGGVQKIRILNLSAWDAKAIPLDREGFEQISTKMPFFKNTLNVDEELADRLAIIADTNTAEIKAVVDEILDDQTTLLRNADITREYMRMKALTTGAISFSNNGVSVAVDYGIPDANKVTLTSTAKWDAPSTADPVKDINDLIETIQATGADKPDTIIMNSTTFGLMRKTAAMKNAIYVFGNGTVTPNIKNATQFVQDETGCELFLYDKGIDLNGTFTKFVPDNCVVLCYGDNVGQTRLATTPEERDLRTGKTAEVAVVDGAVAVTQYVTPDPVVSTTKVSMICLPSLEGADSIGILTVA